jgi:transposase
MAEAIGLSKATISRIWQTFGLQSHRVDTFKLSADPQFVEKVRDIVGLYLNPPDHALVLSLDEKSQVQALDRTRPMLPMRPGIPARQTHDYIRNGTTSLFTALNVATGRVIGRCYRRHRHKEFLKFLDQVDASLPPTGEVHVIMDNYGTHKVPKVARWFARHPRYHVHFTPTSASWLNQVERFFAEITTKRICRGSFHNVRALEAAIDAYLTHHNANAKPFIWTATADAIIDKVKRFCERTSETRHGGVFAQHAETELARLHPTRKSPRCAGRSTRRALALRGGSAPPDGTQFLVLELVDGESLALEAASEFVHLHPHAPSHAPSPTLDLFVLRPYRVET